MRAPVMLLPFNVANIESAMPTDTSPAPIGPHAIDIACDAGRGDTAIAAAGITYCTAAFTPMYSRPTAATPKISEIGRLFCGSLISLDTLVTMFQPSYTHRRDQRRHEPAESAYRGRRSFVLKFDQCPFTYGIQNDRHDHQHLQNGEEQLELARLLHSDVVQERNRRDRSNRHQVTVVIGTRSWWMGLGRNASGANVPMIRTNPVTMVAIDAGFAIRKYVQP